MTTLPAVVRIIDLPTGTTISGGEVFEAVQTVAGQQISVQVPISQVMTSSLGALPIGGGTSQILGKSSGNNFSTAWYDVSSFVSVNATTGLATTGTGTGLVLGIASGGVGSTQLGAAAVQAANVTTNAIGNTQFRQGSPLSVIGVAGAATANVADIGGGTAGQVLAVNAGATGIGWTTLTVAASSSFTGISNTGLLAQSGTVLATGTFGIVGTTLVTGIFGVVGTATMTGVHNVVGTTLFTSGTFGVVGTALMTGVHSVVGTALFTSGTFGVVGTTLFTSGAFGVVGTVTFTSGAFGVIGTTLFTSGAFGLVGTALVTGTMGIVGTATIGGINLTPYIPVSSKSAAYTAVLADANTVIYHPSTDNNPRTFTIDSNANVAYTTGTCLTFVNDVNTVTIAITSDTLVFAGPNSTGSRTLAAGGMANAVKVAATRWYISGAGLS